nr:notchless protein like [Quercus suber]
MSTSLCHRQLPPTSSSPLIHVAQVTQPHDGHVEQGQRDQVEQGQTIMLHLNRNQLTPSNQRDAAQVPTWLQLQLIETLTLQPNSTLDATRKEVNAGRVQPKKDIFLKEDKLPYSFYISDKELVVPLGTYLEKNKGVAEEVWVQSDEYGVHCWGCCFYRTLNKG